MLKKESEIDEELPLEFYLSQNYPNPFKEKTIIKYCVAYKTRVQITVYNTEGEVIEKLIDEEKKSGTYELTWNAANLPSGVYFYRLQAGEFNSVRKMILLK